MFRSEVGRKLLIGAGAAEFVADKLPWTQSRLAPRIQWSTLDTGLFGRVALVALAGAALGSEYGGKYSVAKGALFAALGAILGNLGGYYFRTAADEATGLPDPAVAVIEDAAAVALLNATVPVVTAVR
ncbi:hypothetical protein [Sphaerimonospora thailandensis]|uniref:DUF4126 domain-containing protein n=1 Tax=Sphaerimonospora thailandensis TaxID=795644 RepID=A0A8J3VXK7_9ACTN|nr:hypothetical protein [Sphaerimonospora thailandensis]GIH68597.1 hypothetical protein Mth01_08500 [Sphaerimonospora thailandensis]